MEPLSISLGNGKIGLLQDSININGAMDWPNLSITKFISGPSRVAKEEYPLFLKGLRVKFLMVG